MKERQFLSLNLGYVAFYAPHLLERFTRTAFCAEKIGECKILPLSTPGGDLAVFNFCDSPETATEVFAQWHESGVPKAAMKLLPKMPMLAEHDEKTGQGYFEMKQYLVEIIE